MAKKTEVRDPTSLLNFHLKVLANLKKKYNGCVTEDIKSLVKRDIVELEEKIERVKKLGKDPV